MTTRHFHPFQPFAQIPPPPHAIDILQYVRDAHIDIIKRFTASGFIMAKETHSILLIQRPIENYKRKVRASVESADEKRLPATGKTIHRGKR